MENKVLRRCDYLWNNILYNRDHAGVSLDRARLFTESWKQSDGNPVAIRRGLAMKHVLENIPLYIDDQQLICGSYSSKSMYGEWYPEYESKFLLEDGANQPALKAMAKDEHDEKMILEIAEYWKDKCCEDQYLKFLPKEFVEKLDLLGEDEAWVSPWITARARHGGYYCVDVPKVIEKGYKGIIAEIDEELANTHILDSASLHKVYNLKGWKLALEGGIAYGKRCAQLCRDTAAETEDEFRKAELLQMAEVCDNVPENPARSFHEAVQVTYFSQIFVYLDTRGDGVSPGRCDQYLYPLYKHDMDAGIIDKEKALDILQCFRVKENTFRQLSNKNFFNNTSGEAQFHNITIGGTDGQGNCTVNELSYLFLDAAEQLRIPHPTLSVRYNENMPEEFLNRAVEVAAMGGGYPAFFNDKAHIACLKQYGVSEEDANNYCIGGCVQAVIPGKTAPGYPVFINLVKCLELALNDGFDPFKSKKQIGPHTGKFEDFKTYEELVEAFKVQLEYGSRIATRHSNFQRAYRDDSYSAAFTDALIDNCIKVGSTAAGSGAKYNLQYHNAVGVQDLIDSLAALKKCVYEDKSVDAGTLLEALHANFEGYEDVRKILLNAPKYGNDDDYVDTIAYNVYHWWAESVRSNDAYSAGFGTHYYPGAYSVGVHVGGGHGTGALPDGRYADDPLADGSMSPCQGADTNGPTAVINSANKIDQIELVSTLTNMKFNGNTMKTPEDRMKLAALIKTYFAGTGKHIQFNIVSKETLIDAQANPDKHRSLLVRVAGYSAFFVELIPNLQKELITRTENEI